MMKAVVLDITDGEATVMTKDGDIIGVSDKCYDLGQEITIEDISEKTISFTEKISRFMPAVAAAAALLIIVGSGSYVYMKPYGTVSLDVNPSIEYTINRFDRVLDVNGVNDDGDSIVSELDIKKLINKDIETAVEDTIEQIEAEGYFTDEEGNYVVVTANTKKEKHTDELVEKLDKKVAGHKNINPITSKVSDDDIKEAHEQGISAGKKMMVDRLYSVYDDGFNRDDWNKRSVKDILGEYDRIQKGEGEAPHEENVRQSDDTPSSGSGSMPGSEPAPVIDDDFHNEGNNGDRDEQYDDRPNQEAPDKKDDSDRMKEDFNRTEENRQPAANDIPTDNVPIMDDDRPVDNGNSDIGGQPVPDEDRSNRETPMQWDDPGNGNGEPPMMQNDHGNGQMQSDPGDQPPPQDHGRP